MSAQRCPPWKLRLTVMKRGGHMIAHTGEHRGILSAALADPSGAEWGCVATPPGTGVWLARPLPQRLGDVDAERICACCWPTPGSSRANVACPTPQLAWPLRTRQRVSRLGAHSLRDLVNA